MDKIQFLDLGQQPIANRFLNEDEVVRENDGNEFYELRCLDCGAKLAFGAHKKGGGLFPRRKDIDGEWLSDRGWQKWNPKTKTLE